MTTVEAAQYLGVKDGEDVRDAYATHLFTYKTFFLTNRIIYSVFTQKLTKLSKIEEAAEVLGVKIGMKNQPPDFSPILSMDMIATFNSYQQKKSDFLHRIHLAETISELKMYVSQLIELHSSFIVLWPKIKLKEQAVQLSEELDPVTFLKQLYEARERGIITFTDLIEIARNENSSTNQLSDLLQKESMRLYLLSKKEEEWKKHSKD